MNILIIGSGGREHAIGWKIGQSKSAGNLFFAPGNPGTAELGINLPSDISRFDEIKRDVLEHDIHLLIVGPENPLVEGIRDYFESDIDLQYVKIIGPGKAGARLEGSKEFAKNFMQRHNIPTARFASFTKETVEEGFQFLKTLEPPYVLKADGLASGKGVLIIDTLEYAQDTLWEMLVGKFGDASKTVVIEEFLAGTEVSVFALTDGTDYLLLPEAKDYKRIGEGDTGLNTGGMGAISPVPFASPEFMSKVEERIIRPTIAGLKAENIPFTGFIFFGLINCNGEPYVIEYNTRLGDPETEAILPRIKSDFLDMLLAASENRLRDYTPEFHSESVATIVLVSGGYPAEFDRGKTITGIENINNSLVFHAGTKLEFGKLKSQGGRVIAISSMAETFQEALTLSKATAETIQYDGKYFRRDIGFDL